MICLWIWGRWPVRWISLFIAILVLASAGEALAQGCSVSVVPVSFGGYDSSVPSPLEATGGVDITCDSGIPYTLRLDPGQNSGGGFNPRRLGATVSTDTLNYNLYRDSSRVEVWGDGTSSTFVRQGVGSGAMENLIIYGRIPGGQIVRGGLYTDAVTVTVEW
jgi:spore coat protein U-like protein